MGRTAALTIQLAVVLGLVGLSGACGDGEHRPQLLVNVSTDLATLGDLQRDDDLSAAASFDRVRAEILDADGTVTTTEDFPVASSDQLPLSFGILPATEGVARVRLTAFRDTWSLASPLTPVAGVSVERLFVVRNPASFSKIDLVLRGDCFARPSDFVAGTTCIDATTTDASAGASDASKAPTASWSLAHSEPCASDPPKGMICIAGGLSALGDPALIEVDAARGLVPSPPTRSPFRRSSWTRRR